MGSFIVEFWAFLRIRKKYWLAPMMITMALFGALLVATQVRRSRPSSTRCLVGRQGADAHSRDLRLLPRQCGGARRGRTYRRRAQEERFSRKKQDARYPENAIRYCLDEGGLTLDELDYVVFYEKPFIKFERLLETYLAFAPRGFASFRMALPLWLKQKLFQKDLISKKLKQRRRTLSGSKSCCSLSTTAATRRAPSIRHRSTRH